MERLLEPVSPARRAPLAFKVPPSPPSTFDVPHILALFFGVAAMFLLAAVVFSLPGVLP